MNEQQPPLLVQVKPARHFVSGLASGIASAALLQPLDLLKTRVQQSGRTSLSASWRALRESSHPIRAMWRGTVPSCLRTGFGSALYFTSLNSIRQRVRQMELLDNPLQANSASSALPTLTNTANVISGAVARTFAGFVLMPLTVIKVRFESSIYSYPTLWSAARNIQAHDGVRGFFSGFGATAMRDAPYAGMYVLFYEMMKSRLGSMVSIGQTPGDEQLRLATSVASSVNFCSGILSGAVCSAISNPIDVCKTRIQLQPQEYRNVFQASYKMLIEDGFWSLWDGLALRMSRKALSSALAWTIYEELIRRSKSV